MAPQVLDVAVVASWFPSIVDHVRGRFIADQLRALRATAGGGPAAISFDPAELVGSDALRSRLAASVAANTARALAGAGPVFAPAGWGGPAGVPVARLPIPNGRTGAEPVLHAMRHRADALDGLADRWLGASADPPRMPPRPLIVHAHTGYPDGAAAAGLAGRLGVPLVITEHASFLGPLLARPALRAAYVAAARGAARLVVVSETLAGEIRRALPEIAERIVVLPNAVAVDDFRLDPAVERRPDELLYVGHRTLGKGLDTLLEAFARLRASRPALTLRLIGQAPDRALDERWAAIADRLGLAGAVTFEPPATRPAVAAAMARAGVFVHASRRETFGVVVAEALAAGLPVVATASGGVGEIMADGEAHLGALVPPGDPDALAAAIGRVLDERATFDPATLRRSVVERFGSATVAARLVALYRTVLDEGGSADQVRPTDPARAAVAAPGAAPVAGSRPASRILVAFDRDRLRLAEGLPADQRERLLVVTSRAPGPASTAFEQVVTADLGGRVRASADAAALGAGGTAPRRLWRIVRHPLAVARRRGWVAGPERYVLTRGRAAIRAALRALGPAGGDAPEPAAAPELVCLDGLDHLAAAEALERGQAVMPPGGLRWLGDLGTLGRG